MHGGIMYALIDFLAMHGNFFGCIDTETNLITLDLQDGYRNIVSDSESLIDTSGQD